jgi:hypothetical protein
MTASHCGLSSSRRAARLTTVRTRLAGFLLIFALSALLGACGGSSGPQSASTPVAATPAPVPVPVPVPVPAEPNPAPVPAEPDPAPVPEPLAFGALVLGPQIIDIANYTIVSSTPISGTVYEYTYTADVTNWTASDLHIAATLTSTAASTIVVDRDIDFGDVAQGATIHSTNTFTIRQDRSQPFDSKALAWAMQTTALAPTTYQLLEQARASGAISAETALVYGVFYEFNDARLPAQYRGRDDGFSEARASVWAEREFDTLSPATQAVLAPFLLPPMDPGSWLELEAAVAQPKVAQRASAPAKSTAFAPAAAPAIIQWSRIPVTVGGAIKAWIWWRADRPEAPTDSARAEGFRQELENYLWNKLTGTFGPPLPDDVLINPAPQGQNANNASAHGPDSALDIYLTRIGTAVTRQYKWPGSCTGAPTPTYILLDQSDDNATLAHELMHAILAGYPLAECWKFYHWMHEASATWAQHFAYRNYNTEHGLSRHFLFSPDAPLHWDPDPRQSQHQYGAYLWFFNLSGQAIDPSAVKLTWAAAATNDSISAIDKVRGGFKALWQPFLANNWNRLADLGQPHRDYFDWDQLRHMASEQYKGPQMLTLPNFGAFKLPIKHELVPLSSQYEHYNFTKQDGTSKRINQVWFFNEYAGNDPRANVQAIVKIKNQNWRKADDWTGVKKKLFCRENSDEDLEELVLIISNLDVPGAVQARFDPAHGPTLGGPNTEQASPLEIRASPLPCHDWLGTVNFSSVQTSDGGESITTTAKATNVLFAMDRAASNETSNYYDVVAGQVTWQIVEVLSYCSTATINGAYSPQGELFITLGGPSMPYLLRNTSPSTSVVKTVSCAGGPTDFTYYSPGWLPDVGSFAQVPDVYSDIDGSTPYYEVDDGWHWHFTKVPP